MWSRRAFLKSSSLALLSLGAGPRFLDRAVVAAAPGSRKVLVSIFLRGAMDGLMAVPPLEDPALRKLRPRLAMSGARASAAPVVDLDGRFGLHPAFEPLRPFWGDGRLAIVHAAGSPNPTRSHFDAQDFMETGTPWRKGTPSGWLNRVARASGSSTSPFRTLALSAELPRSLYGPEPALAIADLAKFGLKIPIPDATELRENLERLYAQDAGGSLQRRGRETFEALRLLSQQELATYRRQRAGLYPSTPLAQSLMQIAYLIQAGVGLQLACAEHNGWDTHVAQGTAGGAFSRQARDLADALAAFWKDIELYQSDVTVLTMTEFGRTVRENGSRGTDHGHGSCLFVLGNDVDGGKVYGDFPERLVPEALFDGRDLPVTTDFRAVFAEVAGKLFDIRDDQAIFPGWTGERLPVLW